MLYPIIHKVYYTFFRDAVCIFYLVLRALDTVEDDMTIPYDEKVTLLQKFYTFHRDPSWNYTKALTRIALFLRTSQWSVKIVLLHLKLCILVFVPLAAIC